MTFDSKTEALAAQFRPLIDVANIQSYPRKTTRLDWLLAVLTVVMILLVGALWMN